MLIDVKLELIPIIALIVGGLAIFLYGITSLSNHLKIVADGDTFRRLISKATSNRVKSCALGTGFTALIQSSGGTYALSIGLVKAGALEYPKAIAIVIGANLGTCITAFLIAIPGISQFMPFVAFVAAFVMMIVHNRKVQTWTRIVFYFSLIFFGIWLMETFIKNGVASQSWFNDLMVFLNATPWLGLLFGTVVTLVLQSCSAVIGVVQGFYAAAALASGSPITLFGILPIVIGSNIGAMIPSILSAFGGNATAKRVAFVNGFMKISGGLIFMGILYGMQGILMNSSNWSIDPKLQVALGHLIFNVMCVLLFLPLVTPLCKLSEFIIKDKKQVGERIQYKELDSKILKTFPSTGISLAYDLSVKMMNYDLIMFKSLKKYIDEPSEDLKEYVNELEKAIDNIDRHLADFLLHAESGSLGFTDQVKYAQIVRGIKDMERIGDYGENLLNFYVNINEKKDSFDEVQLKEINTAHESAVTLIGKTMNTYKNADKQLALEVIKERRTLIKELEKYQDAYFAREMTKKGVEKNSYISLIYVDILNCYERVYAHCSNIAKLFNTDKELTKISDSDQKRFINLSQRY